MGAHGCGLANSLTFLTPIKFRQSNNNLAYLFFWSHMFGRRRCPFQFQCAQGTPNFLPLVPRPSGHP
eukprot:12550674-Prorocentrum_lima.AAC.1